MKIIFMIFVCFFSSARAIYGPELKEKLLTFENDCLTKTVGRDAFNIRRIDKVRTSKTLPDDGSLDKFAVCILQKYHVLNDDGSINENVENYYLISEDPKRKQEGVKCKMNTGSNTEETARNILKCFLQTDIHMIDAEPRLKFPIRVILSRSRFTCKLFGRTVDRRPWRPIPFFSEM